MLELHKEAADANWADHPHVATVLLHAYAQHEAGREHMQHLLAAMPQWTTETYNVLLNMHGRANDAEKVKELLQKMRDESVEMNDVTFGTLVTVFGKQKDTSKIKEIIGFLREKEGGAAITSRFYSVLASTMSKAGDVQGVNDAWEDLLASKLAPDTEVYNQFLALYGKHHNVPKMQSVMETMMRQVPPNPVTATTVLDMLGKSGRIAEMEALLADMKASRDAQPTSVTYHQVLNAYAKTADVAKMEKLHEEMTAAGIKDTHVTYNILADGYGRAKRFEQLEDLLKRRDEAGIPLDELGYCVLVASYGRVRGATHVRRLADNARQHYPHLITKKVAWAFVDSFCRCKDVPAMKEWMEEVFRIGAAAANINNGTEGSVSSSSDAAANGLTSSTTVEATESDQMAMIGYYCRAGLMDDVTVVVDDIEARGGELSYSALNALARGYATVGRFELAVTALHKMRDRSLVPDSSTTLALSSIFLKAGLHEQAQQIVQWRRQYAAVAEAEHMPDSA